MVQVFYNIRNASEDTNLFSQDTFLSVAFPIGSSITEVKVQGLQWGYKGGKEGQYTAGMSKLLASLGHTGRRRVVLGHMLNTQTLTKANEKKKEF